MTEEDPDNRNRQRGSLLKTGLISRDRGSDIHCIVRNLSPDGACVEVGDPAGIPDSFTLVIESDDLKRTCQVTWRSVNRVGLAFTQDR